MIDAHLFTAQDIMATKLVTVTPDTTIFETIRILLKNKISGAPVIDEAGSLCGVISERDCMRILAGGSYDHHYEAEEQLSVAGHMSTHLITITPADGIYHIVDTFEKHGVRRLPVLDQDKLVGMVSRRDVLRGIQKMEAELLERYTHPLARDRRTPKSFFGVTKHESHEIGAKLR